METIATESLIQQLGDAIRAGEVGVIVGVALLLLCGVARAVTRERLTETVGRWVSATTAVASGVALLLVAGREWYEAVLLGLFALPASAGFWALWGTLLPARRPPSGGGPAIAALLLVSVLALGGCPSAPRYVRSTLEGLSAITVATDELVAAAQQPHLDKAAAATTEAYEREMIEYQRCRAQGDADCVDPGTPEEYIEHFDRRIEAWSKVSTALNETKRAIVTTDEVVRVWRDAGTDDPPAALGAACRSIKLATDNVLHGLALAEHSAPPQLEAGLALIEPACNLVGGWILETREKGDLKC